MEAKDTVIEGMKLCNQVCQEYRQEFLEAKPCGGKDCEECMLTKQAQISFEAGRKAEREFILKI